jgi:hypothetical protein
MPLGTIGKEVSELCVGLLYFLHLRVLMVYAWLDGFSDRGSKPALPEGTSRSNGMATLLRLVGAQGSLKCRI